jgi:hypothetical protein
MTLRHDIAYALIALLGIALVFASLHLRRRRIRYRKAMRGWCGR